MSNIFVFFIIFFTFPFAQRVDSMVRVGACETPGSADGVFTQGQYSYIADRGGLTSVDISVPTLPLVSDYLNEPRCEALGVFIKDTVAYINSAGGPSFTLANISNPAFLVRLGWVEMPIWAGSEPKGIYAKDSLAYFADGSAGFLIISIADLLTPAILCTLNTPGRAIDLCVRDTLTYIADLDSLLIVNVVDPHNPVIIGHIGIPEGGAYDVSVTGNYAFVTEEDYSFGQGKITMIDVSNPTAPTLVKQISITATPYGLFVVNDKVYVAADDWWAPGKNKEKDRADIEGGIRVIHWQAPDSVSLLVSFDTPGRCRDIFVVDSFIYIAAWDSFMIYKYLNTDITEQKKKSLEVPGAFLAYPNPFSYQTKISFTVPTRSFATVEVYDTQGRRIRDLVGGYFIPGQYQVIWDGKDNNGLKMASGVYYIKLSTKSGKVRSEKEVKIIFIG